MRDELDIFNRSTQRQSALLVLLGRELGIEVVGVTDPAFEFSDGVVL